MAKYYVQSGTMRTIVQAPSGRKAALWAVHQAMQQVLPIDDQASPSPKWTSETAGDRGVAVLSAKVSASELGFDRPDAVTHETMEVVAEWNQMVTTLDRLQRMLGRAA